MTSVAGGGSRSTVPASSGRPGLMLATATIGFAVNFWAWALLSPLGPLFRTEGTLGSLSESDVALLVAVPVIVGSLGRIPVGALTTGSAAGSCFRWSRRPRSFRSCSSVSSA